MSPIQFSIIHSKHAEFPLYLTTFQAVPLRTSNALLTDESINYVFLNVVKMVDKMLKTPFLGVKCLLVLLFVAKINGFTAGKLSI